MARILVTSGPTRQYLDPVRYLTNASSGRMGAAIAHAAVDAGHDVVVVSGPVNVSYPPEARIVDVVSTEEMLEAASREFRHCDGLIGVAAPCDYRPITVKSQKMAKTGEPLVLNLVETPDVVATLGAKKQQQWVVGFALETKDHRFRALAKLERKSCDLMVLNGAEAIDAQETRVEVIDPAGQVIAEISGSKDHVGRGIFRVVSERLVAT